MPKVPYLTPPQNGDKASSKVWVLLASAIFLFFQWLVVGLIPA